MSQNPQPYRGDGDPLMVNKAKLVEKIAELVHEGEV